MAKNTQNERFGNNNICLKISPLQGFRIELPISRHQIVIYI